MITSLSQTDGRRRETTLNYVGELCERVNNICTVNSMENGTRENNKNLFNLQVSTSMSLLTDAF